MGNLKQRHDAKKRIRMAKRAGGAYLPPFWRTLRRTGRKLRWGLRWLDKRTDEMPALMNIINALCNIAILLMAGTATISIIFRVLPKEGFITYEAESVSVVSLKGSSVSWNGTLDFGYDGAEYDIPLWTHGEESWAVLNCDSIILPSGEEIVVGAFHQAVIALASSDYRISCFTFLEASEKVNIGSYNYPDLYLDYQYTFSEPEGFGLSDPEMEFFLNGEISVSSPFKPWNFTLNSSYINIGITYQDKETVIGFNAVEGDMLRWHDGEKVCEIELTDDTLRILGDTVGLEVYAMDSCYFTSEELTNNLWYRYAKFQLNSISAGLLDYCDLQSSTGNLEYTGGSHEVKLHKPKHQDIRIRPSDEWYLHMNLDYSYTDEAGGSLLVTGQVGDVSVSGKSLAPTFGAWLYDNYSVIAVSIATSVLGGVLLTFKKREAKTKTESKTRVILK